MTAKMAVTSVGSRVDTIYRAAIQAPKFFTKGWGDIRLLARIFELMKQINHPKGNTWKSGDGSFISHYYDICRRSDIKMLASGKNGVADVYEYEFRSPLNKILPGSLPKESEKVRFQLVIPHSWLDSKSSSYNNGRRPICIHLAGTGDHFYWRRRHFMALPLVKENDVASIIVENPFYGSRKPKGQNKSGLRHVSDLFVMGVALTFEVMTLLDWCEKKGYGPLAVTGISMGGHMASISATVWNKPIAIVPCLSWSTAAPVFTKGVMKYSVSWKVLQEQLKSRPDYIDLLERHCPKYAEHCKGRKRNFGETNNLDIVSMESSGKKDLLQIIGRSGLMADNYGTNLYYSKRLRNYDIDKKKLGIFAVDFDALLKLDNLSTNLMSSITGRLNFDLLRQYSLIDGWNSSNVSQDTTDYMNFMLYQLTDLQHFSKPHSKSSMIFVSANHDSYVPMNNTQSPVDIWSSSEMRSIDCGHVMGVLRYQKVFRDAIRDALSRL